ncbi:DUF2075 domain-containing protein [Pontibacter cellulosilyticus]|uniref:DUF2075 domain-containing protein n=1 Tax=Pontibacter cellulosilyticus TaxID=1720253 RepID=A0A923N5Y4_9BACT|nr:DUF2075 domain-containing protein [Pontibacter cellulosilyticus]MBC5992429.1 DUF2075 domain-containing protein [Pontibacter cellulosilyticus]
MRLYQGSSLEFIRDNAHNSIVSKLEENFFKYYRQKPQPNEILSWKNSLKSISKVFDDARLYDHGVLVEYQLPLTSKRLDCLICGKDKHGTPNAVIIELKQWSESEPAVGDNEVTTWLGGELREVLHPSAQVGQYREYLSDVHSAFTDENTPVQLYACAYLHNYTYQEKEAILDPKFKEVLKENPVFATNETQKLEQYLLDKLSAGDGLPTLDKIAVGSFKPSKKLMVEVGEVLRSKSPYVLLDDQLIVYDKVKSLVEQAQQAAKKTAVIVKGGPGTGKSVIALHLMTELAKAGFKAHYATGSKAFTETLRAIFGTKSAKVFKYFNNYVDAEPNSVDVLICDEAHRIRESSFNRFKPSIGKSVPQLYELLRASKVSVLFIDDNQIVRPSEVGSIAYVKQYAASKNVDVIEYELESQFRCNGSDGFINWINNTLGIQRTANVIWSEADTETFDFRIYESAESLEAAIMEKAEAGYSARLTAGFCWPWSEPDSQGNLVADVKVGSFQRPWNAKPAARRLSKEYPTASLWAYDPKGIGQVGCVYTAQGFEFDYVGVIVGEDMKYNLERSIWLADPSKSHDGMVKKDKARFIDYIKNTYKVLMTRGMKGCYVYFVDKETEKFFRSRIEKSL